LHLTREHTYAQIRPARVGTEHRTLERREEQTADSLELVLVRTAGIETPTAKGG